MWWLQRKEKGQSQAEAGFKNVVALVQEKEKGQNQAEAGFKNMVSLAERERLELG